MAVSESDLDNIVAENNLQITFRPETDTELVKTFSAFEALILDECRFWAENSRNSELSKIATNFQEVRNLLNQAKTLDVNQARTKIAPAIQRERIQPNYTIYSRTAQAKFLVNLVIRHGPEVANGALAYLTGDIQPNRMANKLFFAGLLSAFLFVNPGAFADSLGAHQTAFEQQRTSLNSYREELVASVSTFTQSIDAWRAESELKISQLLDTRRAEFDQARTEIEKKYGAWQNQSAEALQTWQEKMQGLQSAYTEKLKLEGPTKYWKDLEDRYLKAGRIWTALSVLLAGALTFLSYCVLYKPPDILKDVNLSLPGLRGSILMLVLISAIVYLLTLFVKISTSAYHLARDARERLQLTLVYLALMKDAAVKDDDRKIILQSLFSRADTGLLKGDSGPAMPSGVGNILELIKNKP
jgi:hypothetical protein